MRHCPYSAGPQIEVIDIISVFLLVSFIVTIILVDTIQGTICWIDRALALFHIPVPSCFHLKTEQGVAQQPSSLDKQVLENATQNVTGRDATISCRLCVGYFHTRRKEGPIY